MKSLWAGHWHNDASENEGTLRGCVTRAMLSDGWVEYLVVSCRPRGEAGEDGGKRASRGGGEEGDRPAIYTLQTQPTK